MSDSADTASQIARSVQLKQVCTTLVEFRLGELDPAAGAMATGTWFSGKFEGDRIVIVGHVEVDAPGGEDGKPRRGVSLKSDEVGFIAHVHVEGMWEGKSGSSLDLSAIEDDKALALFANTTGRINLYPYLRAAVSRLCGDAGLAVPPLPPLVYDVP